MEFDIVRAWKDSSYRQNLSAEQQSVLPENPVGDFELSEAELERVNGGGQGVSIVGCEFTGGERSQCPSFGTPNGSCEAFAGPYDDPYVSHALRIELLRLAEICL